MLLETNETLTTPVDMNHLPVVQFPVVEHSNLNNTDLAFLDDLFFSEQNLPTVDNMTDFISLQGNIFPDRTISNGPSENIEYDTIISQQNYPQYTEINSCLNSSYSIVSVDIHSDMVQNKSTVDGSSVSTESLLYDLDSLVNQETMNLPENETSFTQADLLYNGLSNQETMCLPDNEASFTQADLLYDGLSNQDSISLPDESSITAADLNHERSSITSESDQSRHDYSQAGKKYLQMRRKNNIASQRSRKLRKQKNVEMIDRLKKLEIENKELSQMVTDMEKERDALQKLLFSVISKK